MKRLFISQPRNGKTDEEILYETYNAVREVEKLLGEDIEVIDSFYTDFDPDELPLEYLARAIKDLASADVAYFAKGWVEKRGCKIEFQCAKEYGIETICADRSIVEYLDPLKVYTKEELAEVYKKVIADIEK